MQSTIPPRPRRWALAMLPPLLAALAACSGPRGVESAGTVPTRAPALNAEQAAAIVAAPDRSAADRTNDVRRKPVQMLAFIGVRPGSVALDLSAGGGYTSELLARAVGPSGRVYAQVPPRPAPPPAPGAAAASAPPQMSPNLARRAGNPALANLVVVVQPFESPVPATESQNGLDLVTMMFNYHDMGHMRVDRERMNRAVFAALKPGGTYVIADHAGRPGTGISESGTLHRVEEAFVRSEVERAGFRFVAAADFLRNPADPRDRETPEPAQPKDEFVLKFVKP